MKRDPRIVRAASAALVVLALGGAVVVSQQHASRARAVAAAHAEVPRFAWKRGTEYVYAFELETTQRATSGSAAVQPIEGALHLRGELAVRCYEASGGRFVLGYALSSVEKARLTVGGGDDAKAAKALAGSEVIVTVDDRGRDAKLSFRRELPETVKVILGTVASSMSVSLPDDAAELWEADEPSLLGRAHVRYQREADTERVLRQHVRYESLLGAPNKAAEARVDDDGSFSLADGALRSLHATERVDVAGAAGKDAVFTARVRTSAELVATRAFDASPPVLAELESRAPNEVVANAAARENGLAQLAGTMTLARIETTLTALAMGVSLPTGFVTSAVAFLQLHPELAAGLVDTFERPDLGPKGRAMVCDLLASAGHPAAQTAMRDALSSAVARRDSKEFGALLQRFSFVATPTRESLDFVYREFDKPANDDTRSAAAFTLGSTMGNTVRGGDRASVKAMNDRLRADLDRARHNKDKKTLLAAIGNAGIEDDVAMVRRFAHDASAEVRAQAAYALRKTNDAGSRAELLDMVADADPSVTMAALDVLSQKSLDHAALGRVSDYAHSGSYDSQVAEALVTFVGRQHGDVPVATDTLEAVAAKSGDPRTRARAEIVLSNLRAGAGGS